MYIHHLMKSLKGTSSDGGCTYPCMVYIGHYVLFIVCHQGMTEWAVLIGYFQFWAHSNHTWRWYSEKTDGHASASFKYKALPSVGNQAEVTFCVSDNCL